MKCPEVASKQRPPFFFCSALPLCSALAWQMFASRPRSPPLTKPEVRAFWGSSAASHGRGRRPRAYSGNFLEAICCEFSRRFFKKPRCFRYAGARRFSRPDGYLVYLTEAEGQERSHPNLPAHTGTLAFGCISASGAAATFRFHGKPLF